MKWIFLSPHLDDAVFSCGGFIWERIREGQAVEVWTICAGDPPEGSLSAFAQSLHDRWGTGLEAVRARRSEDRAACQVLGAGFRHFTIADCVYRLHPATGQPLYASEEAIFGPVDEAESGCIQSLAGQIAAGSQPGDRLVCPLAIGGHVDHRLVRRMVAHVPVELRDRMRYYADFPYVEHFAGQPASAERAADRLPATVQAMVPAGWRAVRHPLSEQALAAWTRAMRSYRSQLSTFWSGPGQMEAAIRRYAHRFAGSLLWQPA